MKKQYKNRELILRCLLCGHEHTELSPYRTEWSLLRGEEMFSFGVFADCYLHKCDDGRLGKYELVGFGKEEA